MVDGRTPSLPECLATLRKARARAISVTQRGQWFLVTHLALTVAFGWPPFQAGAACIDYRGYLRWLSTIDVPDDIRSIAVTGTTIYVTDYRNLTVFDAHDATRPAAVDSVRVFGPQRMALSEGVAYVAASSGGLAVVAIDLPWQSRVIDYFDTPGLAYAVTIEGAHAYVCDGPGGLRVFDISNRTTPTFLGSVDTPGNAVAAAVSGDYAYVADSGWGLQIIDVSAPSAARIVGYLPIASAIADIGVIGSCAYVAADDALHVVDISDSAVPVLITAVGTPGRAHDLTLTQERAFVAAARLHVFDITVPRSPVRLRDLYFGVNGVTATAADGTCAFVSTPSSWWELPTLRLLDVTVLTGVNPANSLALPFATDVVFVGDLAYAAYGGFGGTSGLRILEAQSPAALVPVGDVLLPMTPTDIGLAENHAYIANGPAGLSAVDVTDPHHPQLLGNATIIGSAVAVAISGTRAYVAHTYGQYYGGIQTVDISEPDQPVSLGHLDVFGNTLDIAIAGRYAYVTNSVHGLTVFDLADPITLKPLAGVRTAGSAMGVALAGDYAYVAARRAGLQIVDITDPHTPRLVAAADTPGTARGVAVTRGRAYVADEEAGLQVIDVSDPSNPILIGGCYESVHGADIAVHRGWAYAPDSYEGVNILPLQCSGSVDILLGEFAVTVRNGLPVARWRVSEVDRVGAFRLVACRDGMQWAVDYERTGPGEYEGLDRSERARQGGTIRYELLGENPGFGWTLIGERVIEVENGDRELRLLTVGPNPLQERSTMNFDLPYSCAVDLIVYDLAGRAVRTIVKHEVLPVGRHRRHWDGRDERGRWVAAGGYVCQLRGGGRVVSQSLTIVH